MRKLKHPDHSAKMAKKDLLKLSKYSGQLFRMINEGDELEGWVKSKITKASDYISSVYHHLEYESLEGIHEGATHKTDNPYAIGMAAAKKQKKDSAPLKKSTIKQGHKIAKSIKKKVNESAEHPLTFKQMLKLVVESGGQQQLDPVDESLFAWAQRVAESKCSNPSEREIYAGLVYERMGGVFNMYDVLSENALTESVSGSVPYELDIIMRDKEVHLIFDNDAGVVFDFDYEFNGREVDAGFGYEYGSISDYHDETEREGGFDITFLDISYNQDQDDIAEVAKQLGIPESATRDFDLFSKALLNSIGGEDSLVDRLREELDNRYWAEFAKDALDNF